MSEKTNRKSRPPCKCDEELIDVLTAISVVARILAIRLRRENERTEEIRDE